MNYLYFVVIYSFILCNSQALNWEWTATAGGLYSDRPSGLGIDSSNNAYITGSFSFSANFEHYLFNSVTSTTEDIFLAKYNPSGDVLWAKQFGGPGNDYGIDLKMFDNNYIYTIGEFSNTADFDTAKITSYGDLDVYIAKYDLNGNLIWIKTIGGDDSERVGGIALAKDGHIYVTGYFNSYTLIIGNKPLLNPPGLIYNIFIA